MRMTVVMKDEGNPVKKKGKQAKDYCSHENK